MNRPVVSLLATLLLSGCASSLDIYQENDAGQLVELPGVPIPETRLITERGLLTYHSAKAVGANCTPVPAVKRSIQPTGKTLYISMKPSFFSSHKLSVSFHPNGLVDSIGSESGATSTGVIEFVSGALGAVGIVEDQPPPPCDSSFIAVE